MQKQAQSNWQVLPPKSMTLIEEAALAVENGLSEQKLETLTTITAWRVAMLLITLLI